MAEVVYLSAGLHRRTLRSQLQRLHSDAAAVQGELRIQASRQIAKIAILQIDLADLHTRVVSRRTVEPNVAHRRQQIVGGKVHRQLAVVDHQHAVADVGPPNRQIEDLLHRIFIALDPDLRLRSVRRTIGVHDHVNHRTLKLNLLQADLPLQERNNMQLDARAIHVRVRQLVLRLQPVNRQAVRLELQARQIPAERSHLNPAACGFLDRLHHLPVYQVSKTGAVHIPRQADYDRQQAHSDRQPNPQPLVRAPFCGFFCHVLVRARYPCVFSRSIYSGNNNIAVYLGLLPKIVQPHVQHLVHALLR